MRLLFRAFSLSLLACVISLGTVLLPQYTLSPRDYTAGINRHKECIYSGEDWQCEAHKQSLPHWDPGAVSWQEFAAQKYFHEEKGNWNPYIGSGYPIYLDGIFRPGAIWRDWMVAFPTDQGRDVMTFLRLWIWSAGIAAALLLLKVRRSWVIAAAFSATLLPFPSKFFDIVFLDVDLLGSWILVVFLWLDLRKPKNLYLVSGLGLAMGYFLGSQSFLQSMLVFAAVFALYFVIQVLTSRRQDLKPLFVFGVSFVFSFAFKSLPYALATLNSLAELVSTRSHGGCNTSQGWPLSLIFEESLVGFRKNAEIMTLFPITGLIVLAGTLFNRQVRNISALVWSLLIFQIFSLGSLLCGLPGVSAINFVRHLIPYVQMSYLVLAIYFLSQLNFPKWTKRVSVLGFLLLVVPGLNRNVISVEHFKGKYLSERAEPNYSQIKNSVYNTAQSLSQSQDRRHFSPDLRLFPNFSSLLEIMDLRVVYPFYPRSVFDLNRSLVLNWQEAPAPDRPDRFVGINMETSQTIDPGLEKLLILHRVSMVSIGKGNPWLNGSVYGSKHCEIQIQDTVTDLYVCNHLQGVGFFPKQVLRFNDATEILEFFKTSAVADLVDIAAHAEPEQLQPAQGQILKIERLKDKIIYHLDVQSPGLFVYSDAWFSGWQTMVNDQPAKLTQVNQAFKGTLVPQGLVKLEYSFEKYY